MQALQLGPQVLRVYANLKHMRGTYLSYYVYMHMLQTHAIPCIYLSPKNSNAKGMCLNWGTCRAKLWPLGLKTRWNKSCWNRFYPLYFPGDLYINIRLLKFVDAAWNPVTKRSLFPSCHATNLQRQTDSDSMAWRYLKHMIQKNEVLKLEQTETLGSLRIAGGWWHCAIDSKAGTSKLSTISALYSH